MKFLFVLLISFSTLAVKAQTQSQSASTNKPVQVQEKASQKITVQFGNDKEISNLLIIVTDNKGQTVFLDNQYRFKGDYERTIDLVETGAGAYTIKVVRDEDVYVQQIQIR
ncbi:MAG: hypothetical protein JWO44_256 [Bacteroidetes bacterium]|nr:hypothetical protein [Bacteroidota bacterium]